MSNKARWFHDPISANLIQSHRIKSKLYSGRTRFQSVDIIDTTGIGRCLVLDGKIQSSEKDEFIYHEALVQPAMIAHPNPKKVFIAGGGEGATLREVLRHKSVEKAVMVDIDEQVVGLARKWLGPWHKGAFDDPRTVLLHEDARKYLENTKERFDVLVIDIPDPVGGGPAYLLYTEEFYRLVSQRLTPEGVIVVQSGPASWTEYQVFVAINKTLSTVFPILCPYQVYVPSFGTPWGFTIASQRINPSLLSALEVDDHIESRVKGVLKSYDGWTHEGFFLLPKHLRERIARGRRIITDKKPLFIYQS